MNAATLFAAIEAALPTLIQIGKLVAAVIDGDAKAKAALVTALQSTSAQPAVETAPAAAPANADAPKRGPGRPRKADAAPAVDLSAVTSLCSAKMAELTGKLNGDDNAARKMVKEAVKEAAGVDRLKEVPAEKLAAVKAAVEALDVPEQGGDEGELDEF